MRPQPLLQQGSRGTLGGGAAPLAKRSHLEQEGAERWFHLRPPAGSAHTALRLLPSGRGDPS